MSSPAAREKDPANGAVEVSVNGTVELPIETVFSKSHQCQNCTTVLFGTFCSHCGQKADLQRLSVSGLFKDVIAKALDLDSAYLRTLIGMFRHPGRMISAYVEGEREPYVNPIKFFLLTIGLTVILRWITAELGLWQLVDENRGGFIVNNRWFFNSLLQPPLASALVFLFWRSGRNLAENFAFGFFVTGLAFFYMSIGEFTGYHVFAPDHPAEFILEVIAFVAGLTHAGVGFYKQRALYVIPKMFLAVVVAMVSAGTVAYIFIWS